MTQEILAISVSSPILETSHSEVEETSEVRDTLAHWLGSLFRAIISKCSLIPFPVTLSFPLLCPCEPSGSHTLKSCAPNASSPFSLLCHSLLYRGAIVCCESMSSCTLSWQISPMFLGRKSTLPFVSNLYI